MIRAALILLLLAAPVSADPVRIYWRSPASHQGLKRVWNRYANAWVLIPLGCSTRDSLYDTETRRGYHSVLPLSPGGRLYFQWRKAGDPWFTALAQAPLVPGPDSLLVNLPQGWGGEITIAAASNGGQRTCGDKVLRIGQ